MLILSLRLLNISFLLGQNLNHLDLIEEKEIRNINKFIEHFLHLPDDYKDAAIDICIDVWEKEKRDRHRHRIGQKREGE